MKNLILVLILQVSVSTAFSQSLDSLWVVGISGSVMCSNKNLELAEAVSIHSNLELSDSSYLCLMNEKSQFVEISASGQHSIQSLTSSMIPHNSDPINIAATILIERLANYKRQTTGSVQAGMPPPIYQVMPEASNCRANRKVLIPWRYTYENRSIDHDGFQLLIKDLFDDTIKIFKTYEMEFLLDLSDPIYDSAEYAFLFSIELIKEDNYRDRSQSFTKILEDSVSRRIDNEINEFLRFQYPTRMFLIAHYLESEKLFGEANLYWNELLANYKGDKLKIVYERYIDKMDIYR
ncbi:MAG: hypothetical protein NXI20_28595 [bacterium]|nr:hypothetical protein [bacterium]